MHAESRTGLRLERRRRACVAACSCAGPSHRRREPRRGPRKTPLGPRRGMRPAVARPASWTRLRRASASSPGSARSTGVSPASNSSRSETTDRDSSSRRLSSSARGSAPGSTAGGACVRRPRAAQAESARETETAEHPRDTRPQEGRCYHWPPSRSGHRAVLPERLGPAGPIQSHGEGGRRGVTAYELVLILDPELAEERRRIVDRTRQLIERGGGSVTGHDSWDAAAGLRDRPPAGGGLPPRIFYADPSPLEPRARVLGRSATAVAHLPCSGGEGHRPRAAVATGDYASNTRRREKRRSRKWPPASTGSCPGQTESAIPSFATPVGDARLPAPHRRNPVRALSG